MSEGAAFGSDNMKLTKTQKAVCEKLVAGEHIRSLGVPRGFLLGTRTVRSDTVHALFRHGLLRLTNIYIFGSPKLRKLWKDIK